MTISLITANPDTSNPADFAVQADLAWQQLIVAIPEINTAIEAFNFNATNSTSTTSLLISVASKSLTVQTGKSYQPGMAVTIAYTTDPSQWMRGEVTSYNSGTGALVVNVRFISDTVGTYTAWTISQASIESTVSDSKLLLETGNGHGSTSNKIRLLTTTTTNTGTAFSVSHSASLGTVITINEPGIYAFSCSDYRNVSNGAMALTINASGAELTTSYGSIARDRWVGQMDYKEITAQQIMYLNVVDRLDTGDTIRLHTTGNNDGTSQVSIAARKIGNV